MKKNIFLLFTSFLLLVACKKEDDQINATDFSKSCYQNVLKPLHNNFEERAAKLKSSVDQFVLNMSEAELDLLRKEWENTFAAYSPTEVFNIDNIKDNYAHLYFYKFPVDTIKVINNIQENPTNAIVSSNSKGLGAVEYLLFRKNALDSLLNNSKNVTYLQALVLDISEKSSQLKQMWVENEEKYNNNQGSNSSNAFNQLVNGMIQFTENLKMLKVGNPLGKQAFDHPNYLLSQAPYSNKSIIGIQQDLEILKQLWTGTSTTLTDSSVGLGEIVKIKNKEVYDNVSSTFTLLDKNIEELPENLNDGFENLDATIDQFYKNLNALYTLFRVDVSAQLDVTVFISDLDGD